MLQVRKAKDEDSIVLIITCNHIRTYYRFYGARHSILQLGNLVDFEVEGEDGRFLPRLRSLSHIGFHWQFDHNYLMLWHNFIQKFESHLKDADELNPFYFDLLLNAAKRWGKQNPKRIICESYLSILHHEGRLYPNGHCYICEQPINEEIALMQSFKPAHPGCIYSPALPAKKIFDFLKSKKSTFLEDSEVEVLYSVIMKGF
ncbi:MAG: recombination protein RecO [Sulfurovum sp.]|nr:recombination protein RecO [Sulfurovum sp.]MCB4746206.1 recombination protein RecO [Sulfurovum sp.]MCB4751984.1 recombination protein RecO [Sulfurovum sp.]MCB4753737.1 recombination protein RecO [Sulfurovum sp.]MCB4754943.1 recombination protein RecO [Sulfurovum sp.]